MNRREQALRRMMFWGMAVVLIAVLSACSGGPSVSIQALIDEAAPSATVTIPPGTYRENVTISKSIVLVGEVNDSRGVEIVGKEAGESAIEISGSADVQVTLRDIAITRSHGMGITTSNAAIVTLENVQAKYCASGGLLVREQSSVTATDCEFSESDRNGITVIGDGVLEANNCLLEGSAAAGLAAVTTKDVLLTSCSIRDNGEHGLDVGGSTALIFREVTISDNGHGAPTSGKFVTLGTVLFSQAGSGVWVKHDASILFDGCLVSASAKHGIVAFDNASVELVNGEVSGNGEVGVHLLSNGAHCLRDALITENVGMGVFLAGNASVEMNGCTITANEVGGVATYSGECYGAQVATSRWQYTGVFTGFGNTIPGPSDPQGNLGFGCCPESRCRFLESPIKEPETEASGT